MELKKERIFYLDVARVIAILCVVLNHAVNRSFDNYAYQYGEYLNISTTSTIIKAAASVASRLGVPLFLMITGALLLNKKIESDKDITKFYKKNLLSIFITSEIWYVIMFFCIVFYDPTNMILEQNSISFIFKNLLKTVFFINPTTMGSMWYIPMILCVYLIIPFIALIKDKVSLKSILPIMLVLLIFEMFLYDFNGFFNLIEKPKNYTSVIPQNNLISFYFLYIFAGYYINKGVLNKLPLWTIITFLFLGFFAIVGYQYFAYSQPFNFLVNYYSVGVLLLSSSLFEIIRRLSNNKPPKKLITYISKISFAIYFVHIVVMEIICWNAKNWLLSFSQTEQLIILYSISFISSIFIIFILSKFKIFKKYLFLIKD